MKPQLDAPRWSKIRAVFDELVELDAARRSARLASIGSSDPDLQHQVEALLSAHAAPSTALAYVEAKFASSSRAEAIEIDRDPLGIAGRTVSHFRIGEAIAAGGMGVVYAAQDARLHRATALKFPLPSHHFGNDVKERFLREARSAAALDHPNICGIYEVGEMEDGGFFLAMPLYEGETLRARLSREGVLPLPEALSITRQIVEGLRAAHRAGIVHRDLKPANVMLLPDGTVKILDFGLAKVRDLALSTPGTLIGTVGYMSPERFQGQEADSRADLWAIGVMLYEMLTGRRPFDADADVAIAHAIVHAEPPPASTLRPEIGSATGRVISTLLRKDPAARYASADQLAAELAAIANEGPAHALSVAPSLRQPLRHRWLLSAVVAVVAILVVMAAMSASLLRQRAGAASDVPRIVVVLPLTNASGDSATDDLSIGLSDAIARELSRLRDVVVPSYLTTLNYPDADKSVPQIASELGAAAVVHGGVQRMGDRVRLDLQVFDSAHPNKSWRRQYDPTAAGILDMSREAVADLLSTLPLDVADAERARMRQRPTTNAQAYDLFLRGRAAELRAGRGTSATEQRDGILLAQSLYSRARDIDPSFALARARLALAYLFSRRFTGQPEARLDQARLEAEAALRLDADLPEAHEALARYWGFGKSDFAKAAAEMELALRGMPNNVGYRLYLADSYRIQGLWEESLVELERTRKIESRNPLPAMDAATTYSRLRRYPQAIEAWDRAILLEPDNALYRLIRGHVFIRWQGTADTLAAAVRAIPWNLHTDRILTNARFQVARVQRRWNDALTVVNSALTESSGDELFYRPRPLMRAEIYDALGHPERARSDYEAARAVLLDSLAVRPDDERMRIALGLAYAGLGRKQEAIAEARRAMELVPLTMSSLKATAVWAGAVGVFVRAGDADAALELLEMLFPMPAGREVSVPLLRVDPTYDPLRSDPRFEQLLRRFSNQ